jgi:hypothetical protein
VINSLYIRDSQDAGVEGLNPSREIELTLQRGSKALARDSHENNVRIAENESKPDPLGGLWIISVDVHLTPEVEATPLTRFRFD